MKKNIIIIVLIILLLFSIGYIIIINKGHEYSKDSINLKVIEAYKTYSLATIIGTDEIVEIGIRDLDVGDELLVEVIDYQETYPRSVNYSNYKIIRKGESTVSSKTSDNIENISQEVKTTSTTTTIKISNIKVSTTINNTKKNVTKKIDAVSQIEEDVNNKDNISTKEKAKTLFIKIIDFIFYEKDINGYYFKDLSLNAKLKVISLSLKIDSLIDKNFPGYKEELNGSYSNAKSKLVECYLNITTDICDSNSELCEYAKEDFIILKKSCNLTWDIIKSIGETGAEKLKNWYEIYSGK